MELGQLRYFLAVVEDGGFGRAAVRLGVVQSAVSQRIRALERGLGLELFDRSGRHARLTAAGERLLVEARAVLEAADRTREVAAGLAAGGDGLLRLGVVHGPGPRLYQVLGALAEVAPGLRVRPVRLPPAQRPAAVLAGTLDAAFLRGRVTVPGLELLPMWTDPLYAALPADHPAAADPEPEPARLAALPLRLAPREANPAFHDLLTGALPDGAGFVRGPEFTTLAGALSGIAADRSSWTVFYRVAELPDLPGVVVRPLRTPALTTHLAVPAGPPGPAVRSLLTALHRVAPGG
ncbi:LysR family transcriptional regulator [Kitasatospora hibisci]|uniref:LysR family transcriptional regulator n=1 Tax=Kitasatospora hibisci TaxID=3369522 RepID=UPI003754F0A1